MSRTTVLVLGGGVGGERDVSINGANAVAEALGATDGVNAELRIIERISQERLRSLPGDLVFPVLHGPWGEGGPLQDLLVADGRPFVGSGPRAARLAMDKIALKFIASSMGVRTAVASALDPDDDVCPLSLPVVVKPVREGSTVGLHVCRTIDQWRRAHASARASGRASMVEPLIEGRELTVGVVGGEALPIIEIIPPDGLYDYEAKYTRDDTGYVIDPDLPDGLGDSLQRDSLRLVERLGARHIARLDYMLDADGRAWLLELNTMPGFTDHSLVPMAARRHSRRPMDPPALCARLVELAMSESVAEAIA